MTNVDKTQAKIAAIKVVAEKLAKEDRRVNAQEVGDAAKAAYQSVERNS
jgi:hypothetical protein